MRFIQLIFDKKLWCLKKVTFTNIHEWQEPCVVSLKISVKDNVTKLNIRLVKIKTCIFSNTRNWIIHAYFLLVHCGFATFAQTCVGADISEKSFVHKLKYKNSWPLLAYFRGMSWNDLWKTHPNKINRYLFSFV